MRIIYVNKNIKQPICWESVNTTHLGTRSINMLTKSLIAIIRTCHVRHACIVGNVALSLGKLINLGVQKKKEEKKIWTNKYKTIVWVGSKVAIASPKKTKSTLRYITKTHTRMTPSPAATSHSPSAIQHVLDGEIDIVPRGLSGDLNPICQGRESTVRPAWSTVLLLQWWII